MNELNDLIQVKEYYEVFGNMCAGTDAIMEKWNITFDPANDKESYKVVCNRIEILKKEK